MLSNYAGKYTLDETGRAMALNQKLKGGASINELKRAMRVSNKRRNQNPIEEGRADIVPWILYDRLFTSASTTTAVQYSFFTTPISGTKNQQDTNLQQVSQLPNPQHFNTTSLQFYFSSQTQPIDIGKFLDTYYFQFWIGDKVYAQGPLSMFPGGAGVTGFTTANATSFISNGMPSPHAIVDFRMGDNPIGHHILQGQNFYVNVITAAGFSTSSVSGAIGISLLCVLNGVLSRSVQ